MTKKRTTYHSEDCKDKLWNKATIIAGKDKNKVRKDVYEHIIHYNSYGKQTRYGWQIDHIKPKSKGGSDDILNLQALSSNINNKKSDSEVKKSRHSSINKK